VKQAEEDKDHNDSELQKAHVEFLEKEVQFNSEVNEALLYIKEVEVSLRHAEELVCNLWLRSSLEHKGYNNTSTNLILGGPDLVSTRRIRRNI
jgi:hypothetical protein